MTLLDSIVWWTGALVLVAGAGAAACAVIFGLSAIAAWLATWAAIRFWNIGSNWHLAWQWSKAGKPIWKQTRRGHSEMVPEDVDTGYVNPFVKPRSIMRAKQDDVA